MAGPLAGPIVAHPIRPGAVYWVSGGGGNTGVIIGQSGVILIDVKTTPALTTQLVAEIAKLTPKPITHIILTHSDSDHVNGLLAFPADMRIIAHENNRREQETALAFATVEVGGGMCLPPGDRLPNQLVKQARVVTNIEGVNLELLHFGPGHTSGDLIVYLPDHKVVFAGDILTTRPTIKFDKGGSFDGWFTTARGLLALDATTYIAGHPDQGTSEGTKAFVQKKIDADQATRDKIIGLITEGKSLADIRAAMGEPPNARGCRGYPSMSISDVVYAAEENKRQELQ